MKKIFLLAIIFMLSIFCLPVRADIIPVSSKNIKYYGVGLLNMPKSYTVYQYPYKESKIIKEVNYENIKKSAIINTIDMRQVSYIAHIPESDIALLTVDLNPGNDWYCVFLDQTTGETGWVYNDDKNAFMTYKKLFYKYGKQYGIRIFSDLPKEERVLYAKQDKSSQVLTELTYPRHINFTVIHGNWILVSVRDISNQPSIGWFNWRNDNGTLNMFPNLKEQR